MVAQVVKNLVGPFSGMNHVVYMDNYFTSGPLVDNIYDAEQRVVRFPEGLKNVKLSKGNYACERVGDICDWLWEKGHIRAYFQNRVIGTAG